MAHPSSLKPFKGYYFTSMKNLQIKDKISSYLSEVDFFSSEHLLSSFFNTS